MKRFTRYLASAFLAIFCMTTLVLPIPVFAATTPSLGVAETYGVLASTYTNTSAATTVNGDVGFTTPPAIPPLGIHTNYGSGAPYPAAGIDQGIALTLLNAEVCDFNFGAATDLSLLPQPLIPGVYCVVGAMSIGAGGVTLNGSGTYIFRSTGALNTAANSIVTLVNVSECDVFWTPVATTLGATSTFAGTVIDDASITIGANTTWIGRALSFASTVTTGDTVTITVPACLAPVPATLHVIKTVINDDAGTAVASDAVVHVEDSGGVDVTGSPQAGAATPGTAYSLNAGTYTIIEDTFAGYDVTFTGDCDAIGVIVLAPGDDLTCTITNDDVAAPPPGAILRVIKTVINNNTGTAIVSDFDVSVKNAGIDVVGSPAAGTASPGTAYSLTPGTYVISEDSTTSYTQSFTGDCDALGSITLAPGDDLTCIVTNDDVARTRGGGGSSSSSGGSSSSSGSSSNGGNRSNPISPPPAPAPSPPDGQEQPALSPTVAPFIPALPNTGLSATVQGLPSDTQPSAQAGMRLIIPKIGVDSAVEVVELTLRDAIDTPQDPMNVAWFNLGPRPGETGSAVMVGHYGTWKGGRGSVFDNLHTLQIGDTLTVRDENGVIATFAVRELRMYGADEYVPEIFISSDGTSHLNLITCTGVWNAATQQYSDRLVVFTDRVSQ